MLQLYQKHTNLVLQFADHAKSILIHLLIVNWSILSCLIFLLWHHLLMCCFIYILLDIFFILLMFLILFFNFNHICQLKLKWPLFHLTIQNLPVNPLFWHFTLKCLIISIISFNFITIHLIIMHTTLMNLLFVAAMYHVCILHCILRLRPLNILQTIPGQLRHDSTFKRNTSVQTLQLYCA